MYLIILAFLCLDFITEARSEEALIFNLQNKTLEDIKYYRNLVSRGPILIACPSSTQHEKQFNEELSVSGNSLFLRDFYLDDKYRDKVVTNICASPFKPAVAYNAKSSEILVGYELYYEDGKLRILESQKCEDLMSIDLYKVNDKNETTNQTQKLKPLVTKIQAADLIKFKFSNESHPTLVLHWIHVLSIKSTSELNKHINFHDVSIVETNDHPTDKCENLNHENDTIDSLYSEENQANILKDFSQSNLTENITELACGNPYGCLKKSQIIPLWYFRTYSAKLASCHHANIVPVWKTIADGQLAKVDQYIYTLARYIIRGLKGEARLFFGVSGILCLNKTTSTGLNESQQMYLFDTEHQSTSIPIPKILYRIIHCATCIWEKTVIVVHNDPRPIPETDRICLESVEIEGWNRIKNTDPSIGITYACRVTRKVDEKLGLRSRFEATFHDVKSLELNRFPYVWVDEVPDGNDMVVDWIPMKKVRYEDIRDRLDKQREFLFRTKYY